MDDLSLEIERMANDTPSAISTTKAYSKSWILTVGGILNIYGDIHAQELACKVNAKDIRQIQFARKFNVSPETLETLDSEILSLNKEVHLREVFNGYGAFNDLEFLKYLPNLKSFGFGVCYDLDLSPIRKFVQLENFGLGGRNISLKELRGYQSITSFGFGDKVKDYDSISTLLNVENINIGGHNLKTLNFLFHLKKLKRLSFSLGGTTAFEELQNLEKLEELDIWRTRKIEIENLIPINSIEKLKILKLRELPRIDTLNWICNNSLDTLLIQEMKGLKSFESISKIGNINTLVIKDNLDFNKIKSLQSLDNVKEIQIYQGYLDSKKYIIDDKLKPKLKGIELRYLI
jgi:hypothetical protein